MVKSALHEPAQRLLNYIFPALCIVCDAPRAADDAWLCASCRQALLENHARRDACPRCAMNRTKGPCACSHGWNPPFEAVYSVCDFDPLVQALMHQIKYRSRKALARYLGTLLSGCVPADFFNGLHGCLAIPLHPKREKERSFNQSLLFLRGIVAGHPELVIFERLLRRIRFTASQTALDREQRAENMQGAFGLNPELSAQVKGRRFLLFDDVITTGATTAEAAKTLLQAGCAGVRVLSIARD